MSLMPEETKNVRQEVRMRPVMTAMLLLALATTAHAVKLRWDPPATGEVVGYTMYRGIMLAQACNVSATPVMERYGVAPADALPVFIDSAPVVGANYYEVTAYNSEGESLPSNRVCFARQAVVTSAPRNLGIEP